METGAWPRVFASIATVFTELVDGASPHGGFVLNRGDSGLLAALDRLTADEASAIAPGGAASIAAHVDHLCYGLELLNRWNAGDPDPFTNADYRASWNRTVVSEGEWTALRQRLADQTHRWAGALASARELDEVALNGVVASAAHLAYHLGAIRQINRATRGPTAND